MFDSSPTDLTSCIQKNFKSNHLFIFVMSLRYLMGLTSCGEFQSKVRRLSREKSEGTDKIPKDLRLWLKRTSYVSRNLRAFLYGKYAGQDTISLAQKYGISEGDLFNSNKAICWNEKAAEKASSANLQTVMDLEYMEKRFVSMIPSLTKYAKSFVWRKLVFISNSSNIPIDDLVSEIMLKIIESYIWSMPSNRDDLHTLNYLKRSVHNHGLFLLDYYTAGKRKRLVSNSTHTEFSLLVVSDNQNCEEVTSSDLETEEESVHNPIDDVISVNSIVQRYRGLPKASNFLRLLMGKYDPIFTQFLKKNGICKGRDTNEDLYKLAGNETVFWVAKYLKVDQDVTSKFVEGLRQELTG